MRILIAVNTTWSTWNFRRSLIQALAAAGHDVHVVAGPDEFRERVESLDCTYHPVALDQRGFNPLRELGTFAGFHRVYRAVRPEVCVHFTIKPVIYGTLVCRIRRIPCIDVITGLGAVFSRRDVRRRVVEFLYRISLPTARRVFFQNDDDRQLFVAAGLVSADRTTVVRGSGVNLDRFAWRPLVANAEIRFLLLARLLWAKGIAEYVEAARRVRARHPNVTFGLLGTFDPPGPEAIGRATVEEWAAEGVIEYLGATDDVRDAIARATCVVLPSFYREGVPRSLLEAAALGRPIVTTDHIGCRDAVTDGTTGFLCRPLDVGDLEAALERFIALAPDAKAAMGRAGRAKAEREFDERLIFDQLFAEIRGSVAAGALG